MNFLKYLTASIAITLLVGCATTGQADYSGGVAASPTNGIAIIRVDSTFFGRTMYDMGSEPRLGVTKVTVHDGHAERTVFGEIFGKVVGSYVYLALPPSQPGERYVATTYQLNANPLASRRELICAGHPTPSFQVDANTVSYIGDYKISDLHVISNFMGNLKVAFQDGFKQNIDRARKDVNAAHPEFANMTLGVVEPVKFDAGLLCEPMKP